MIKAFNIGKKSLVIKGSFQLPLPTINAFCFIRRKFAKGIDTGITIGHSLFHFSLYTVYNKSIQIGLLGYIVNITLYDVPLEDLK